MKAYKYFDSALKDHILAQGSFRIGTLYDYRHAEAHGSEIGDPTEGKVGANSRVLSWSSSDPILRNEHAQSFVKQSGVVFREGSSISFGPGGSIGFGPNGVTLKNVGLRSEFQVQDLYVFSFSLDANPDLMRRMGYDACYEIGDVDEFLRKLPSPNGSRLLGWSQVLYRSKEMHFEAARTTNAALLKEPMFAYQRECRALWQPISTSIAPEFVTSVEAASLCSVIDPTAPTAMALDPNASLANRPRNSD
jgi:hypothetical protein